MFKKACDYYLSSVVCKAACAKGNVAFDHAAPLLVGKSSLLLEKLHCFQTVTLHTQKKKAFLLVIYSPILVTTGGEYTVSSMRC